MNKAPNPVIDTLVNLAVKDCEDAKLHLVSLNNDYQHSLSQLNQLEEFRNFYGDQLQFQVTEGLNILHYHNYQTFLRNLDRAIAQQSQTVSGKLKLAELAKQEWQKHEQKRMSFQKLKERQIKQFLTQSARLDQKIMDEFSSRASRIKT